MNKNETEIQLLNIASNLRRIAQWAYEEPNEARRRNIEIFLEQTEDFAGKIDANKIATNLSDRFQKFLKEFPLLKERWQTAFDNNFRRLVWAEQILTWSNLLG